MAKKKAAATIVDAGQGAAAPADSAADEAVVEMARIRLTAEVEFAEWRMVRQAGEELTVRRDFLADERLAGKFVELPFEGAFIEA